MKRYVGNRHLVNFENALICYYMAEKYQEWLKEHCMALEENKLQHRLYMKLHSEEIIAAIQARALWFVAVLQPMRVAVESKRVGNSYVDMFKVVAALNKISMAGLNGFEEDNPIFDQSFDPFDLIKDESGVSKYRSKNRDCITTVYADLAIPNRKALITEYLMGYCRALAIQLERNSPEFFENKKITEPKDVVAEILKGVPTNNIYCERPFAI